MLKLIGAGFGRTATLSLKAALEQISYGPCYHIHQISAAGEEAAAIATPIAIVVFHRRGVL